MCGRYALTVEPDVLAALFALKVLTEFDKRYNLAPSQEAPVIVRGGASDEHVARTMRWGLIPSWSKDSKIAYKTINARSETAAEKPSFRSAYKRRRCLVPASWFYEWKREGKDKIPFRIRRVDGDPLAFAGLWEDFVEQLDTTAQHKRETTVGGVFKWPVVHAWGSVVVD